MQRLSQDRIQQRIVEQVVDTHVHPTVNQAQVKQPKYLRDDAPGQQRSQATKRIEDTAEVKITKMKTKRNTIRPSRRKVNHEIKQTEIRQIPEDQAVHGQTNRQW